MRLRDSITLLLLFCISINTLGQKQMIHGTVKDAETGEALIGVNVVYGQGLGTVTDVAGYFSFEVERGRYMIRFSYVGFKTQNIPVVAGDRPVELAVALQTIVLPEVLVVADVARSRETPVAFSTIAPQKLKEEIASQDIPMLLNSTPGVYATHEGGGDGDAQVTIRGFSLAGAYKRGTDGSNRPG